MPYLHTCPDCGAEFTVSANRVGRRAECPECAAGSVVPYRVRSDPAPSRGRGPEPAGFPSGLVYGALGLLAVAAVVVGVLLFTGALGRGGAPAPPAGLPNRVDPGPVPPAGPPKPPERPPLTFPPVTPVELTPTPIPAAAEVRLPGRVGDAAVGGGGRYWCLLLPDLRLVAVFDANLGRVAKYLPLASGKACLAAGMNKLVVVYPDDDLVARYDLGTFEKEVTARLPFRGSVRETCLGADSGGPMLVWYEKDFGKRTGVEVQTAVTFLDVATLAEVGPGDRWDGRGAFYAGSHQVIHFRASPDGRVYGAWYSSGSPGGVYGIVASEGGVKSHHLHDSPWAVVPATDGTLLTALGLFTPELKPVGPKERWTWHLKVPGRQGDWYLVARVVPGPGGHLPNDRTRPAPARTTVHRVGDHRPVADLGDIGMTLRTDDWAATFTHDKHVLFSPANRLIAWVVPAGDALRLHRFDPDAALEASGADFLFVTTRPPAAEPGKPYRYRIGVRSKKGGVTFQLDAGPPGMAVAADGTLTWDVPAGFAGGPAVIVTVSDRSGQEAIHTFTPARAAPAPAGPPPPAAAPVVPPAPPPAFVRPAADPAPVTPTKAADGARFDLPGPADAACLGGGGRYVVFRVPAAKQLAVFDVSEGRVAGHVPLADPGSPFAAGNEHLWVLNPADNVVGRWNLRTLAEEASAPGPPGAAATRLLAGHATDGPVLVAGACAWLDGRTLKPVRPGAHTFRRPPDFNHLAGVPPTARISADGRVVAWTGPGGSVGFSSLVVSDRKVDAWDGRHQEVGPTAVGPDGILFNRTGLFTPELWKVSGDPGGTPVPPAHGGLYPVVAYPTGFGQERTKLKAFLRVVGEDRPVGDLPAAAVAEVPPEPWAAGAGPPLPERLFLVPDAKALVVLTRAADRVLVLALDPEAVLEKAGVDYLFVAGRPPAAVPGAAFRYRPEVRSRKGGAVVTLASGPDGMAVADGTVTWDVPKDFAADAPVVLAVTDRGGREVIHAFTLAPRPRE